MKSLLSSLTLAAALLALCGHASAGDRVWVLEPGRTWTWTCTTEFHYVAIPVTANVGGVIVRRGGYGGWSGGPRSRNNPSRGATSDPQWETLILRATCLEIQKDGNARVEYEVENVCIEVRFDSNGDYAKWDSRVARTTDLPGFKKFQAILGARFEAIVAPNGSVREVVDGEWKLPEPEARRAAAPAVDAKRKLTKAEEERESEERAASAAHDPTSPVAWVHMTFGMTPGNGAFTRDIRLPDFERLDGSFGGNEPVKGISCERTKFKSARTQPRDPQEKPEVQRPLGAAVVTRSFVRTLEGVSMEMLLNADKKGHSWFSRELGVLLKSEMESKGSTTLAGTIVSASFSQAVELKAVGKAGPVAGCALPPDLFEPVIESRAPVTTAK